MIRDVSHHSYWVNSKALEIAGITADTPDPTEAPSCTTPLASQAVC